MLESLFSELFSFLGSVGYAWVPATPDRTNRCRENPNAFSALVRYFGLGLEVSQEELMAEGLSPQLFAALENIRPAVSLCGRYFVAHTHWPEPVPNPKGFVYLGEESYKLIGQIGDKLETIRGKSVLDLGSGAGGLAFELAGVAAKVLGLEASEAAVEWSEATARAQSVSTVSFRHAWVGTPQADACVVPRLGGQGWDVMVSNPPLALPVQGSTRTHRDGGRLGIELPLLFLDFAHRHLVSGGEVFSLVTNPILHGRSVFFEELNPDMWKTIEKRRIDPFFNQSLYRKQRYADQGIQNVELWYLHLEALK